MVSFMTKHLSTIVILALLFFAGHASAQTGPAEGATGDSYADGMVAFQAGDYATACLLLEQAYETRQHDAQLLLNLAICQFSLKEYDKAEKSYRALHALNPDDPRIKFELGRTLTECGKFEEAEALLLQIRKNNPPPELQSGLDSMLDRLDNLKKRTTFGGSAQISFLNDNNINVGPNDGTLGNIVLDPDTAPKSSTGVGYAVMLGVDHKLDPQGDLKLSGGLSRNEIRYSQHGEYNTAITNVSLRLSQKLDTGSIQGALNYTDVEQGEMNSINTFAPSVMWMHNLARDKQLITDGSVEFRDNLKSHSSDSHYFTAGSYLRWFYGEGNKHYILGGLRLFTENARSSRSSNSGSEFKIAPSFGLPWMLRLDTPITFGVTSYNAPAADGQENDRRDVKYTLSATLSRQLWDKNSNANFSFIHTRNKSNYGPNSYFKNTTKLSFNYNF